MEKGKFYLIYNNEEGINVPYIGSYFGEVEGLSLFLVKEKGYILTSNIHNEVFLYDSHFFLNHITRLAEEKLLQSIDCVKFHDIYEINIPYSYEKESPDLNTIHQFLDDILEDFWSIQLRELDYCVISPGMHFTNIKFKLHKEIEMQIQFNDMQTEFNDARI